MSALWGFSYKLLRLEKQASLLRNRERKLVCSSSHFGGREILKGREAGDTEEEKEWMSEVMDAGGQKGSRMRDNGRAEDSRTFSEAAKVFLISVIINLLLDSY